MKQENIELEGIVQEDLGNTTFRVALENMNVESTILCTISGKIRKNFVRISVGDKVKLEVSPYDLTRGRITFRYPPTNSENKNNKKSVNSKKIKKRK